ncbi:4-oxalocrotonate tautomerase [Aneurinibacillus sp. Ricciae_BoGa-3]|uniref:4-oxalocrotonate tautomerase n=1 Tax=Aneurinibacillus sp. Ricciae_BoGa-3 TaxID=3022697 RepID=UPI0023417B19|nr:4-oxalocrotonate tautomerase [Aneurinibacillus sp. Ricciae_BoGa-3]WCK52321.1 4-oxalocrotonate tautomerase [Aneurinibacillus sp. Ricciae_BoGa-3]
MPLIQIQLIQGRPEDKIKEVIENVTNTVHETLGAPKESIRVIVTEIPKTHWGIGGMPVSNIPNR